MPIARIFIFIFILLITNISIVKGEIRVPILVNANENMENLLESEDTDNDNKITVDDKGDKIFYIESITGRTYKVEGAYYLSNVLMQLSLDKEENKQIMLLRPYYIYENP
ncbi:MAG: trehalase calcium-binding domain-containing protein, partial [Deferribacterota bacterium]|nr:trehalase calcium-binding domain-containing protein [Deferribacterota bacterium]